MRRALLALLPILATSLLAFATPQVYVFYNGTVIFYPNGVTEFRLLGLNVSPVNVYGSHYEIINGTVYFSPTAEKLEYVTNLSSGVIKLSEPYNFTLILVLPYNYSLVYSSPPPISVVSGNGFYDVVFEGDSVYAAIVSTPRVVQSQQNGPNYLVDALVAGLIISNSVLAGSLFALYRTRKERREEMVTLEGDIGDRDRLVLEAVTKGARTLSEIVKATGLPKTTAYRRVKKLVKEGYLVERREGGKVWYELNSEKLKGQ